MLEPIVCYSIGELDCTQTLTFLQQQKITVEVIPPVSATSDIDWLRNEVTGPPPKIGIGAAGCTIAHRQAWEKISKTHSADETLFLVLEDDAKIRRFGKKNLLPSILARSSRKYDLLHLGNRAELSEPGFWKDRQKSWWLMTRALILVLLMRSSSLFKPFLIRGFQWRTHAYLISKRGARILLSSPPSFQVPLDQYLLECAQPDHLGEDFAVGRVLQTVFGVTGRVSLVDSIGR